MERRKYIAIVSAAAVVIVVAVCVYLAQLSATVAGNLMTSVDEISRHDVETIEGTLNNCYARLGSVADRLEVYDVQTLHEAQEQLNLEAASSAMFNAGAVSHGSRRHALQQLVRAPRCRPSAPTTSLWKTGASTSPCSTTTRTAGWKPPRSPSSSASVCPIRKSAGGPFVAMLARSDLSTISSQLVIESFDGQGVSLGREHAGPCIVV